MNNSSRPEKLPYPENLITALGLVNVFGEDKYTDLTDNQLKGLETALNTLSEREREIIKQRYEEHYTLQKSADHFGISRERIRQILNEAVAKLRHPKMCKLYNLNPVQ